MPSSAISTFLVARWARRGEWRLTSTTIETVSQIQNSTATTPAACSPCRQPTGSPLAVLGSRFEPRAAGCSRVPGGGCLAVVLWRWRWRRRPLRPRPRRRPRPGSASREHLRHRRLDHDGHRHRPARAPSSRSTPGSPACTRRSSGTAGRARPTSCRCATGWASPTSNAVNLASNGRRMRALRRPGQPAAADRPVRRGGAGGQRPVPAESVAEMTSVADYRAQFRAGLAGGGRPRPERPGLRGQHPRHLQPLVHPGACQRRPDAARPGKAHFFWDNHRLPHPLPVAARQPDVERPRPTCSRRQQVRQPQHRLQRRAGRGVRRRAALPLRRQRPLQPHVEPGDPAERAAAAPEPVVVRGPGHLPQPGRRSPGSAR